MGRNGNSAQISQVQIGEAQPPIPTFAGGGHLRCDRPQLGRLGDFFVELGFSGEDLKNSGINGPADFSAAKFGIALRKVPHSDRATPGRGHSMIR